MSGFEQDYRADGVGGLPYDPRLMLVTVWWCYRRQWRSPQDMARACREQASLRVVWQREQVPSAACLRRFVQGHRRGWQTVADSLIRVSGQAGLVDVSVTATDSTPVIAPAALSKTMTAPLITTRIDAARRELAGLQQRRQDMLDDPDLARFLEHGYAEMIRAEQLLLVRLRRLEQAEAEARERGRPAAARHDEQITRWQARVDRHTAELAEMTRRQQDKYDTYQARAAAGQPPRGGPPCLPEQHIRIRGKQQALARARSRLTQAQAGSGTARDGPAARANLTDRSARILKGKANTPAWILGWLLTITVISGQFIIAGLLSQHGNDAHGLLPNLTAAAGTCRQAGIIEPFGHHLADGAFLAPAVPATITGIPLTGVTSKDSDTDQQLYTRRSPMIEPVFAHLLRTDRRLHSRGDAAHTEVIAITTAYNATKYLRKTTRTKT
ncbi:hypothetical protein ACQP2E_13915 [Actinoplanes sp. CA-015351]|uniref:hypothetical protein n=1 Tax=Actinoplanes sp. CA-015351 TaxID=3239897 RepID=UPI003D974590